MFEIDNDLFLLLERMKIENVKKHASNLQDEIWNFTTWNLKQTLNYRLVLKKSTKSHQIQWKTLAKTKHWYEHRAKKNAKS